MDINEIFLQLRPEADIDNSSNLIEDYSLDSFDLIILMEEISKNYNVTIGYEEFNMENFLTKASILDMIERSKKIDF